MKDLDVLGLGPETPAPRPRPISVDLGKDIPTLDFTLVPEARAAALSHRPKLLPEITELYPIHWWAQYGKNELAPWEVIRYSLQGEELIASFKTALEARDYLNKLRRRAKEFRDWHNRPKEPPRRNWFMRPPYRCNCGASFMDLEEAKAHRHRQVGETQ